MSAAAVVREVELTPLRLARFERILALLDAIDEDVTDAAAFLKYGQDLDDLSLDLSADVAQIKALTRLARQRTRQLIQRQQARAARAARSNP